MVRYLIDENLPPIYKTQLLRRNPNLTVWMIGDPGTPPKGTLDPEILEWCEENRFLLVTNNRRSMPVHLADHIKQDRHIPGILVFRAKSGLGEILDDLLLIAEVDASDEFRDQIIHIPL
jgi:hypothetical protein